jgi:hypothetical protein
MPHTGFYTKRRARAMIDDCLEAGTKTGILPLDTPENRDANQKGGTSDDGESNCHRLCYIRSFV